MKKPINILAAINLKAAEAGKPRRFSILAYSGGTLSVDGFPLPVVVDLAGLEVPGNIPILIDHTKSVEATLGITDSIVSDGRTLTLGGLVTGQSDVARQVLAQSAAGHQWQASIGAMVSDSQEIATGQAVEVNGQTFEGPVIVARRSVLRETSVLPMGADSTTQVNLAASAATLTGATAMSFEDWLKSLGVDPAAVDEANRAVFQTAYDAMQAPAVPAAAAAPAVPAAMPAPTPTAAAGAVLNLSASLATQIQAGQKQLAATLRQNAEIQAAAAGYPLIAAKAIEEGWNVDKVKLEVLLAGQAKTRPTSFRSAQDSAENMPAVLEAAMCMTRKIQDVEKQYDDKTLQAAHSQFRRGIGLQQLILMCAAANGMPLSAGTRITSGNLREILGFTFGGGRLEAAAFSTVSLPGVLSNVANKEILQGYMEEDAVWREIAQTKSVSDFKAVTSYRMLDNMQYEQLGPGGVIKHGSLGEESYTRTVDTYAKMFSLTRTDMINDDMGAFDDLRARVGRGGAIKLNDLFWTTWLANAATIWTTARTNYISGSTTNLGTDGVGLGLGVKAYRQRRSPSADGSKRISGAPKFVLVPPELEQIADALYTARNIDAVKVSDANTFAGKYKPIVANQLSDSGYTGYSTTAWWLLGDKGMGSPVVVSFLNGQETPTVESADADFNTLGIQFRGYHDFGCDVAEYLNSLMSKGAA